MRKARTPEALYSPLPDRGLNGGDGATANKFLVVGIGASAGGLEAFKRFFAEMPADSGLAFVLVQHLSPDHKSMLAELLRHATAMDVIEATDGVAVKPDCVFVIPPDATMTIAEGKLKIVRPAPPRERRRPIDTFFQSLAQDQGESAIGVILAGTGSDGSLGLTAVKEHGGLTLAQAEHDSHALPGMPESAANTGMVDTVLAVEDMSARIISYQKHLASVAQGKDDEGLRVDAVSHLATIMRALHVRTGYDFGEYKEKTLIRRLQRRMQVLQVTTPEQYIDRIREQPEELDLLLRELLIGVTQFFRDPAAFEVLNDSFLKGLVASKGADEEIRVWVPGCATGEEAYTIAILLREALETRRPRPKIQIFGTDLDERAIASARFGRFRKPIEGLSPERQERWFKVEGEDCTVIPELREMCVFSVHSVIKHPPFSKLDLISCRNLLIYLNASMQDRVMRTFHYALKPGGRLFLGSSESVARANKLFSVSDKKHRIFKRSDVPNPVLPQYFAERTRQPATSDRQAAVSNDKIDKSVRRLMERHLPPHLVIDRANQIVRFSGGAVGQFLEPSPGPPSFGLFDILRKALRPAARDLIRQAQTASEPVHRSNIPFSIDGQARLASLTAERLASQGPEAELTVLALHDAGPDPLRGKQSEARQASIEVAEALEHELRTTRTQLQSTIDELETANEEMKSANEEYQSVNEELQSSNEELETAKEEMQSINEELQTINSELISKNEQLSRLNSDLSNLLETTEIATLFLDESLRVRRFTRGVTEIFHLRDSDIGRPVTEIVSLLDYADLERDVKNVLRKLSMVEREVTLPDTNMTFILRIRPYRTIENVIDGTVLTFIDITDRQAAERALRASETKFRLLFESIDEGFGVLEKVEAHPGAPTDFRYLTLNAGFEQQSGVHGAAGKTIREMNPAEAQHWIEIYEGVLNTGQSVRFESEMTTQGRILETFAFRFDDGTGPKVGAIFLDVGDRKRHDNQQELLLHEMDHRVKNLFAVASSVVTLSSRSAKTPQEMATAIHGRLGALSSAHQLVRPQLGASTNPETTIAAIVETILRPYAHSDGANEVSRATIKGPTMAVSGEAVAALSMVFHELATNAAKYGALAKPSGRVHVSWSMKQRRLELVWREWGGPLIKNAPTQAGFGSLLARRSIEGQLNGNVTYDWNPEGLTVNVSVAAERLAV